jgi:hypothetical protein
MKMLTYGVAGIRAVVNVAKNESAKNKENVYAEISVADNGRARSDAKRTRYIRQKMERDHPQSCNASQACQRRD